MMNTTTNDSAASQKNRRWPIWPLSITIFLVVFVLSLVGFLIFASTQDVGLVTHNYYEKELKYQDQIDRSARAKALPDPVQLSYEAANRQYVMQFPPQFVAGVVSGVVTFYRPSDAEADSHHAIQLNPDRRQVLSTAQLEKGLWRVKLAWEADGVEYYNEGSFVLE